MTNRPDEQKMSDGKMGDVVLHRRVGLNLLWRLFTYHVVLTAVLVLLAIFFPAFLDSLPVGGVGILEEGGEITVTTTTLSETSDRNSELLGSLIVATGELDRLGYARRLIIVLISVWLLMLPVSWVHKGINQGSTHDHSLDETTLILPGIVASIVMVVQHSLALAFSLAGIVAGVQFRRALQDTFDALFILVAIGVGIAAGVAALEIAAVLSLFFTYATLYICFYGDGLETHHVTRRKLEKKKRRTEGNPDAEDEDDSD